MEQMSLFDNQSVGILHRWHLTDGIKTTHTVIPTEDGVVLYEMPKTMKRALEKLWLTQSEYEAYKNKYELEEDE